VEYLPFGETLVEEHLNSNNSLYKFGSKEYVDLASKVAASFFGRSKWILGVSKSGDFVEWIG